MDGTALNEGDYAGLSAWIGCFGTIALTKEGGFYYLIMQGKPAKDETVFADSDYLDTVVEYEKVKISSPVVTLRCCLDFENKKDEARFFYRDGDTWRPLGISQKMYFKMDHFTGCRFGLFLYSTEKTGGVADFMKFRFYKGSKE